MAQFHLCFEYNERLQRTKFRKKLSETIKTRQLKRESMRWDFQRRRICMAIRLFRETSMQQGKATARDLLSVLSWFCQKRRKFFRKQDFP